jgi:tellurite resistance protein
LTKIARRVAEPDTGAPVGVSESILTLAAGSYGFQPGGDDNTMPTGFDPQAAALFESIVEAAYLVATADGVFDEAEQTAFRTVVLDACRGLVNIEAFDALLADLADQLEEDGLAKRIEMVAKNINRPEQQREVLRIASFLAFASGGVSEVERSVLHRLSQAFHLEEEIVEGVLGEVKAVLDDVQDP